MSFDLKESYANNFSSGADFSSNVPAVTMERMGVEYVMLNSFIRQKSFLTSLELLASQSGRVNLSILSFSFCNSPLSCDQYFGQNGIIAAGITRSFTMSLNLKLGFNMFNLSSNWFVSSASCFSWASNGGLIALNSISSWRVLDYTLSTDPNGFTLTKFTNPNSKVFSFSLNAVMYMRSFFYESSKTYLQTGLFQVSVNVSTKPMQPITQMTITDSRFFLF